jgi:hypothetical protein
MYFLSLVAINKLSVFVLHPNLLFCPSPAFHCDLDFEDSIVQQEFNIMVSL